MPGSNIEVINQDLNSMVENARALLDPTTTLMGHKAAAVRKCEMRLLKLALGNAHHKRDSIGNIAFPENDFVDDNPWRAIASAAGFGVLAGLIVWLNN